MNDRVSVPRFVWDSFSTGVSTCDVIFKFEAAKKRGDGQIRRGQKSKVLIGDSQR